jgi:hypothetical protein
MEAQFYGINILAGKLATDWEAGLPPEFKAGLRDQILRLAIQAATGPPVIQTKVAALVSAYAILAQPEGIWPNYIQYTVQAFEQV